MRIKSLHEYDEDHDRYGEIESEDFVKLLKLHDPKAWTLLGEGYNEQITGVIMSALIASELSLDLEDYVKERVWSCAKKQIAMFTFIKRGSIFRWLCAILKELIVVYADVESDEFIELLKTQDKGAWSRLFSLYRDQLIYIGTSRLTALNLSHDPVEDLLQETWMTARQRIDTLEMTATSRGRLLAWLCKIQENHTLNYWRKLRYRDHLPIEDDHSDLERLLPANQDDPARPVEAALDDDELRHVFHAALAQILSQIPSSVDRDIVVRRLIREEKPIDIINRYPGNPTHVYELIRNVKKRLKALLLPYIISVNAASVVEAQYDQAN